MGLEVERLLACRRGQNGVARRAEDSTKERSDRFLVFDHQQRPTAAHVQSGVWRRCDIDLAKRSGGQVEAEPCARTRLGVHLDEPVRLLYYPEHGRESEAGALRSEKRRVGK